MTVDEVIADDDGSEDAALHAPRPDTPIVPPVADESPPAGSVIDRHAAPGPLLRPRPPLAKRLNRNALTVAAALAGVTVLTVVVVTNPSRSGGGARASASADPSPPIPAHPAFLDQPIKAVSVPGANVLTGTMETASPGRATSIGAAHRSREATLESGPAGRVAQGLLPVPPLIAGHELEPQSIDPAIAPAGVMSGGASTRLEAYRAALMSRVLVRASIPQNSFSGFSVADDQSITGTNAAPNASRVVPSLVRFPVRERLDQSAALPSRTSYSEGPGTGAGAARPGSLGGGSVTEAAATPSQIDPAGSPYTLRAGTVIGGLLITGVMSDLPGEVVGQTTRDVYDSRTQQIVLVPRGSHLIGSYDNRSAGTGRLTVTWSRLIFPDGRSTLLPHLAGTDGQGQAGLHDQVDHHFGRVYGAALLTSVLAAGVQLSQPQQSALYAAPSSRQIAAGALGQTMGDVALESARRGLDVLPTIVIRPGQPFNVLLVGDLVFDAPYVPEPEVTAP